MPQLQVSRTSKNKAQSEDGHCFIVVEV